MQENKKIYTSIAVVNIITIISLILALVLNNDIGSKLYWLFTPVLIILLLIIIQRWSVRGLNAESDESKIIQRSFDDTTTLSTVFFGIVYLLIQGLDIWKKNILNNSVVIIGFFIIMLIYELFTFLAIYNANKETTELLRKQYNDKK